MRWRRRCLRSSPTCSQSFRSTEPVTLADIPDDLKQDWLAPDGRVRLRVLPTGDIGTPRLMKEFTESVQAVAPRASGAPASVTGAGSAILQRLRGGDRLHGDLDRPHNRAASPALL